MQYIALNARGFSLGRRSAAVLGALSGVAATERPRLVLFLPVVMGTGVACYFGLRTEPSIWPALVLASMLALLAGCIRRSEVGRGVALSGLAFAIGLLSPMLERSRVLPLVPLSRHAVVVQGVVRSIDALPDGSARLTIAHASLDGASPVARTIRIRLREDDPATLSDGDLVRIRALLRPPSSPAYPGAWDLQRDAFFSGLAGSGFALGGVMRLGKPQTEDGIDAWWAGVRDRVAQHLETELPGPRGAIAATLMVGRSTAIPADDRAAFTNSGLAHLLAVAGLHIGIVMGLAMAAVRNGLACWPHAALRWPVRQIAAVAALATGGLYLLLTGAHLPIVRSFCMTALATLGIAMGRRAVSMRGLAVAAVVLLAIWPDEITGVSFQMSFAAVAALIAGYEALRPVFARSSNGGVGRRFGLHVAALAVTSVLAGTASAPYAAYHFGQIQIYFVLANILAVPITASWVMPFGIASLALMPFGAEQLALVPMGWGLSAILWIGRTVSALPAATLAVPHIPLDGLLLLSAGMAILCLLRSRLRVVGVVLIAAGLLSPLAVRSPDLLVSADARLIALNEGGRLLIAKHTGASKFTLEAYEHFWATTKDPVVLPVTGRVGSVACDAASCRFSRSGLMTLLASNEASIRDCAGAALVVAAFPLHRACDGSKRIDRFSVWRDGAQAVWLLPHGVEIVSDRDWRGVRPWVPPVPTARAKQRAQTLPVAVAE